MWTTYIDAGSERLYPKNPWLIPVSVTYAYVPSGEKDIPE